MKLKFLILLLCVMGHSAFAAAASKTPEEWTAFYMAQAKRHFPDAYVALSFFDAKAPMVVEVTPKAMDREFWVYLDAEGRHLVLCEAFPDTINHISRCDSSKEGEFSFSCTSKDLAGRFCYRRYTVMSEEFKSAKGAYRPVVKDLLPVCEEGVEIQEILYGLNEKLVYGGYNHAKRIYAYFLVGDGVTQKIIETDGHSVGVVGNNGNLYVYTHLPDDRLKIEFCEPETAALVPTNIVSQPTRIAVLNYSDFQIDPENPKNIICLRQPANGRNDWVFFDERHQAEFNGRVEAIQADWKAKEYPFKGAPVNFLKLVDMDSISFTLPFGAEGCVLMGEDGKMETTLNGVSDLHSVIPKPYELQLHHVRTGDGYNLPYYTIDGAPKNSKANRPILWWIEGGPAAEFMAESNSVMDWFLENGFLVVVPRERIRYGFGHAHYKAGVGALHTQSLWDNIAPVKDLVAKGVANPFQVVGYGFSYGGYVMAALATRWEEFASGANFRPLGLIAEASLISSTNWNFERVCKYFTPRGALEEGGIVRYGEAHRRLLESFFPLYQARLQLPLFFIHGIFDHRTPIAEARKFYEKFGGDPLFRFCVEHPRPHDSIITGESIGTALLQNMVHSLLPEARGGVPMMSYVLTTAGIEVKKGARLLHIAPPIPSHNLHLFTF